MEFVGLRTNETNHSNGSFEQQQQLERCRQWLSALPISDAKVMQHTREYRDFMHAFDNLERAHGRMRAWSISRRNIRGWLSEEGPGDENGGNNDSHRGAPFRPAFLQHFAADDIILRVFGFLECQSLVHAMVACTRFCDLARRSACHRSRAISQERQLPSVMQLLRAQEQVDGIGNSLHDKHVRVPTLLLSRRVLVANCGDPELNGIFHCTGT